MQWQRIYARGKQENLLLAKFATLISQQNCYMLLFMSSPIRELNYDPNDPVGRLVQFITEIRFNQQDKGSYPVNLDLSTCKSIDSSNFQENSRDILKERFLVSSQLACKRALS